MSRKRPSGLGSNSRRFATITEPDGTKLKVPAAKDAATFVYVSENGGWPRNAITALTYDVTWLVEGAFVDLKEMRPGRGMGEIRTFQVLEVRQEICVYPGKYGQAIRMVLLREVRSTNEIASMVTEDLERAGGA